MNLGICRPGYFDEKKFQASMQTNWINYDLLIEQLERYDVKITSIAQGPNYGADRYIQLHNMSDTEWDEKIYRSKTQQFTTGCVLDILKDSSVLDGLTHLMMPMYTFWDQRTYYFMMAWACAIRDIPMIIWDTDANFVLEVSHYNAGFTIEEARDKVVKNIPYINPQDCPYSIIDNLDLTVLSPSLYPVNYVTYFPFFPIFSEWWEYDDSKKIFDLVYCGSSYQREEPFLYWYDVDEEKQYSVGIYGKYSEKHWRQWRYGREKWLGHIPRMEVQEALSMGVASIQIARNMYNRIGHITPRVYEVLQSGSLLLMDEMMYDAGRIVGPQYVVKDVSDVKSWVNRDPEELKIHWEQQCDSKFIQDANVKKNGEILMEVLNDNR